MRKTTLAATIAALLTVPATAHADEDLEQAFANLEDAGLLIYSVEDANGIHGLINNADAAPAHQIWRDLLPTLWDHQMADELEAMHGAVELIELDAFALSLVELMPESTGQYDPEDPRDAVDDPLVPGLSYEGFNTQEPTDPPPPPSGEGEWVTGTDRYGNTTHYRTTTFAGTSSEYYATDPETGKVVYEGTYYSDENGSTRTERSHFILPDGRHGHKETTTRRDADGNITGGETVVTIEENPPEEEAADGEEAPTEEDTNVAEFQPVDGEGGQAFCPVSVWFCRQIGKELVEKGNDPYRLLEGSALINPGDAEGTYTTGPRLQIDTQDLVSDPSLWPDAEDGEPVPMELDVPVYPHTYSVVVVQIPDEMLDEYL